MTPDTFLPISKTNSAPDLDAALETFGFESFRPGQKEAIQTLLETGRALLVAPTGGGKSLIYQLPASFLPGTTLVISPLISLMQDQVRALELLGIEATFLAATLPGDELRKRMRKMARGEYRIVYTAPERLVFPGFRALLHDIEIPLIAIDEAHCISEWGHDFRPEYLEIGGLIAEMPGARILGCTATATPVVRDEILDRLALPSNTPQLVHGFARPNLSLRAAEVRSKKERELLTDAVLSEAISQPGADRGTAIVYAPTRKTTEAESERLRSKGWKSVPYHAGMAGADRDSAQESFASGQTEVVVATNAFGMGIDRADVRAVIHLAPPSSIEAYYQEVGRAGRDGLDAVGLLLTSPGDMPLRRSLIESNIDGRPPHPEVVRHKWNLFLELMRWTEGGSCRHDAILRYFDDEKETLEGCGRCDVCLKLDHANSDESAAEVSVIVRKALSSVVRLKGRFGIQTAAKLLKGAPDERLKWSELDQTKTFGALAEKSEEWIVRLLRRCVTAGWIDFRGGDRPVVVVTEEGRQVLFSEQEIRLLLPDTELRPGQSWRGRGGGSSGTGSSGSSRSGTARRERSRSGSGSDEIVLDAESQLLFEALREWRIGRARAQSVPPYVVASDRSLRDLARLRPRTEPELLLAHGIGPSKAEKYGKDILARVREFDEEGRG